MEKEKEIFVYGVIKDPITLEYKAVVFGGQIIIKRDVFNVWNILSDLEKGSFNFPSVRQAKKLIRQAFCDENPPEYACIVIDGKIKGGGWTHTKKHIEVISVSRFKREVWVNSGVVMDEIFKGVWGK